MIYVATAPPRPRFRRWSRRGALIAACVLGVLVVWLAVAAGVGFLLLGLGLAGLAAIAVWKWPAASSAFFLAFLPVNRFAAVLVFHFTNVDLLVKALQLWKEGIIVMLLVRGVHGALTSRRPKVVIFLDLLVIAYLTISVAYFVYDGPGHILDLINRVQGWRTDSSFLLAYLAGRGLVLNRRQLKVVLLAGVPGTIAMGAVAVWQSVAPGTADRFFQMIGAIDFSTLSGDTISSSTRSRGIPGLNVARAGSLMLGDLALAFYELFMVPLAAALYFFARGRMAFGALGLLFLTAGTLGLTITRSAILAVPIVVGVVGLISGRWLRLLPIAAVGIAAMAAGIEASHVRPEALARLWDFNEGSTQTHIALLQQSVDIVSGFPWGHGLGTAGTIGTRYLGNLAIDNENWLLLQATDMGVVEGLLFLAINLCVILLSASAFFQVRDLWLKILTSAIAAGGVGYLFVGNFLHSWENLVVSMGFWLLAGIAVKAVRMDKDPDYGAPE